MAALLSTIAVSTGFSAAPAAAALAPPAAAPVVRFVEDFETLDPNHWYAEPRSLTAYTGAAPYLPTYTADPAWLTHCNGTVTGIPQESELGYGVYLSANNCVPLAYYNAQQLDTALTLAGAVGDAGGNDSLTGRTDQPGRGFDPGAGKVQFRTATQLPISMRNRFVGFSAITAAMNCSRPGFAPPLLQFGLLSGSQGQTAGNVGAVIDACSGGQVVDVGPVYGKTGPLAGPISAVVGNRYTSAGVLYSGSAIGMRIVNQQASGTGNDVALDNISILDVTPQLAQSFGTNQLSLWGSTVLTFTVTNTSELGGKAGFSFTENLPAGIQVAPVAGYSTTCAGASSTGAKPTSKVLTFRGSLAAGRESCTFSVRVSATSRGQKVNSVGTNLASLIGLNVPGSITLSVV